MHQYCAPIPWAADNNNSITKHIDTVTGSMERLYNSCTAIEVPGLLYMYTCRYVLLYSAVRVCVIANIFLRLATLGGGPQATCIFIRLASLGGGPHTHNGWVGTDYTAAVYSVYTNFRYNFLLLCCHLSNVSLDSTDVIEIP